MSQVRCAVYTRKSTEEGLDQAFNSLDAQREACEAYIQSQRHEGWKVLPRQYDDGGASGGNLNRPSLERLLTDIDAGHVDMVVVYKIDRLTRSLTDFAKLVERFDAAGASFVSVTQQFNTSTSMGRLTLNVLLSFAQFEREVTAERIRDKIAASKKKGMWMGGFPPYGYTKKEGGLVIDQSEADILQDLFHAYLEVKCVRRLVEYADRCGYKTRRLEFKSGRVRGGRGFTRGGLYHLLSNPLYIGKIKHHDEIYDGRHQPLVAPELFDRVQSQLDQNRVVRKSRKNVISKSPLAGKLFGQDGEPLTPTHSTKNGRRYRYYVSKAKGLDWRLPAGELEAAVENALQSDVRIRQAIANSDRQNERNALDLLGRVQIFPGKLLISVGLESSATIEVKVPFSERRRGVEAKIIIPGQASSKRDLVLIRRVHRALSWVDKIKAGQTIKSIADEEQISTDYITHNLDLSLLSPEILTAILDGRQRPDVTTAAMIKRRWPADWNDQNPAWVL